MRDAHSQETSQDASTPPLSISSASGLPAGCIAVHNGLTWHGSGRNQSGSRSRRGLGIHFVPANARWNVKEAKKSKVWADYVEGMEGDFCEVDDDQMPVTFRVGEFQVCFLCCGGWGRKRKMKTNTQREQKNNDNAESPKAEVTITHSFPVVSIQEDKRKALALSQLQHRVLSDRFLQIFRKKIFG